MCEQIRKPARTKVLAADSVCKLKVELKMEIPPVAVEFFILSPSCPPNKSGGGIPREIFPCDTYRIYTARSLTQSPWPRRSSVWCGLPSWDILQYAECEGRLCIFYRDWLGFIKHTRDVVGAQTEMQCDIVDGNIAVYTCINVRLDALGKRRRGVLLI